jgi:hypothetical protein
MFDRSPGIGLSTSPGLAAAHPAGLGGAAAETLQERGRAALGSDAQELIGHRKKRAFWEPPGDGSFERGTERRMESFDMAMDQYL